ncbi:MAG: nitroreductase family protein [Nitrospinae bacterium]|nr:nitroreductase family protein [Nitrospinota bacterium]
MENPPPPRIPEYPVDSLFPDRWSPRAFDPRPIPREYLRVIFEAARWAPSAFNEQPWRFLVADGGDLLTLFREQLNPFNRVWADSAPALAFLMAKRAFTLDGKENRTALFDAGAAWMSVALQARKMGLYTHAMAGIDVEGIHRRLGVDPNIYTVICGIALGHKGDPATLPDDLREKEFPSPRKSQDETVYFEGIPKD